AGAAAVEFGLALMTILIPLTAGFIELGRALHHRQILEKSVRDAARYLGQMPTAGDFETPSCSATGAMAGGTPGPAGNAKDLALYGKVSPQSGVDSPLLSSWTAYNSICVTGPVTRQVDTGGGVFLDVDVVSVQASMAYNDLGLLSLVGLGGFTITVSHEQRHIGE
ncbi:MAG: TadE family protein, partial [Alphaproteobacteria bacterium]